MTRSLVMSFLKRAALLAVALAVAWRILTAHVSEYYADVENNGAALAWRMNHPQALFGLAQSLRDNQPAKAEELLHRAIEQDPVSGSAYIALARLWQAQGRRAEAAALAEAAARLAPMKTPEQLEIAAFWAQESRADLALRHLSNAMQTQDDLVPKLCPLLLRLADDPETRSAFEPIAAAPPGWWKSFFAYASLNAASLDTLRAIYAMRSREETKPDPDEWLLYVSRLRQEGLWREAYLAWVNGLGPDQLAALGSVYNGGFELPVDGKDLGWLPVKGNALQIETLPTYGTNTGRSLHLIFDGGQTILTPLSQHLFLDAGSYRLRGLVRTDSLQAREGLRWSVACLGGPERRLAATDRFLGTNEWRSFEVSFEVPTAECPAQVLRLELLAESKYELDVKGAMWFDDLAILGQ